MNTLPIFVKLESKPVLVVGGGTVALRKIQTLCKAGAKVTVVAHEICEEIKTLSSSYPVELIIGSYDKSLLTDKWLVIAATDANALNLQVHTDSLAVKIFVNVVDDPIHCHFITPAIIDRSPIIVAISSGGEAPVLARLWKEKFESLMPQWTGKLAALAGSYRQRVKATITDFTSRRHFWERFFRGDIAAKAGQQDWDGVTQLIEQTLSADNQLAGSVFYVGIGNNNPENLTLKALQAMQLADLIVHDDKVSNEIIELTRKDSDKIIPAQDAILATIQSALDRGEIVVRLIHGCPEKSLESQQELKQATFNATKIQGICSGCLV
jgi:uroporphyrin-III C-methyltransferase/precorrin-2 dehydrogenase/sirohydrochlorin ferrochelatase